MDIADTTTIMSKPVKPSRAEGRAARRLARSKREDSPNDAGSEVPSDAPSDAPSEDEPVSYTIDELSAQTRIPSRTIRFYQSSGVLPKPEKRGRVAYYRSGHVDRLELIGRMQDRGLRMRAIKDLFDQIDRGEIVLSEWLGLEEQLSSAWVDDAPQLLERAKLEEMIGERPGLIAELVRSGLVESRPEGGYLVRSPGLLRVVLALDEGEISLQVASDAASILQKHMGRAAQELAAHFAGHAGAGFGADTSVPAMTKAFRGLQTHSLEAVRLIFAREMEQVLRKMVETGESSRIDKKKRSKRNSGRNSGRGGS